MHLLEAKQRELEYYKAFELRNPRNHDIKRLELRDFILGDVNSLKGPYDDRSITDDFISDVYLEHDKRTRRHESDDLLRTLSGEIEFMTTEANAHTYRQ